MAMPSEYVTDNSRPRPRLLLAPSPTMIDDRMGTIGNTQGVNDRPRPSKANSGRMASSLPDLSAASRCPVSLTGAAAAGGFNGGRMVAVGIGMARMVTPGVSAAGLPSPTLALGAALATGALAAGSTVSGAAVALTGLAAM